MFFKARDIAPLRLVSWVSCKVPDRVQHVLHQLMALFGEVAPVSSDEVLAIGVQQQGGTSSGEISWDMVRDALIREETCGQRKCVASWLNSYNAFHSLVSCTSWT